MNNNKKIIILLISVISLLTFTSFFTISRYTNRKVITDTIKTKELKIEFETNGGIAAKSHSSVVNITDTHSDNIVDAKYVWSTSNNNNASTGTSFSSGDIISTNGLNGTYYLCVYALDDKGFYNNTCSNAFYFDNTAPTITVTLDDNNTVYKQSHNAKIDVTNDAYGAELDIDSFKYVWTKNIYVEPNESFTNGDTVTKNTGTGIYYVMVTACDTLGNCNTYQSNASKFDNDVPTIDYRIDTINGERYIVIDAYDEHSGVNDVSSADGINAETKEKNMKIYVSTYNGLGSAHVTDANNYQQILNNAGYNDVTVVDPSVGIPSAADLIADGYNLVINTKAAWNVDSTLMNSLYSAGINLFTSADDANSTLFIIENQFSNSPLNNYDSPVGNNNFAKRVGDIYGNVDAGSSSVKLIDGTEVYLTRNVNGVDRDLAGLYSNNDVKWFHFQEALMNSSDVINLLPVAVDYIANKNMIFFKIPTNGSYTFNVIDNAGNSNTKVVNSYNIEYYQGNNSSTSGATLLGTSNHITGKAEQLNSYNGTAPSGWSFAGWSTSVDGTDIDYTNNQSVLNLSNDGSTIKLYAVFERAITFHSGLNNATQNAGVQYYNPYNSSYYSTVSAPAPSTTNLSGWSARGYRANTTAADRTYVVTTSNADIGISPSDASDLYAVYSRTITMYHGLNKASTTTATQYYNSANNISAISAPAPSTTNLSGWSARGYREDTTAADRSYAVTTSAVNITPAYNSSNNLYAVYNRTLTFAYNGNGNTGGSTSSQTGTQYYNSNNSVSTLTIASRGNGFTKTGYNFNKWAYDSASGSQVAAGGNISFAPTVDKTGNALIRTMFATWSAKSITCGAKTYLPANSESCANCNAGYYCPGGTWTYNGAEKGRGRCPAGSYSGNQASGCTACQGSTSGAGSSSCPNSCGKSNVASWNTATWNASNNTVSNVCSIKTCASGYTLSNNTCSDTTTPTITVKSGQYDYNDTSSVYTASFGGSGGSVSCKNTSNSNAAVTTIKSIGIVGKNTITCTATGNNGKTATASNTISVYYSPLGKNLGVTGGAYISGNNAIIPHGGWQYGPYIKLQKGTYQIHYTGSNLNSVSYTNGSPANGYDSICGSNFNTISNFMTASGETYYRITTSGLISNCEFRIFNTSNNNITVSKLEIIPL